MAMKIGTTVYFIETGTNEPKQIHKGELLKYNSQKNEYLVHNFNTDRHEWLNNWQIFEKYHKARFVLKTTQRWKGMGL